ncbi:MAG: vitamin K epoxide reductase family protein [Bdellovibrionales bacterium]
MKKWLILSFITAFISSGLHFYLTKRTYQLQAGTAQTSSICNISEKINCDQALLSPYSKIFGVSLSSFGVSFNLVLSFLLFCSLVGFFRTSSWRKLVVSLSGFVAFASLVMLALSLLKNLYCPMCWATYILSFINLVCLLWVFRKDVFNNFFKDLLILVREKSFFYLAACIFAFSFFLHMIFVTHFDIKDHKKQIKALLLDWKYEEAITFSKAPLLKKGPEGARITLVEFADFLCPSCQRVQASLKTFFKNHPDVAFHFYAFPLDGSCNKAISFRGTGTTCLLSQAVFCAQKQNQGWKVHDFIFDNQDAFRNYQADKNKVLDLIRDRIQDVALDSKSFLSCLESPQAKKAIQDMAQSGTKADIQGTPSFFVNGKSLRGFSDNLLVFLNSIYETVRLKDY